VPSQNFDLNGRADIGSNVDVVISSDVNCNGTGDIVFQTGGVERARIKSTGLAGGIAGGWDKAYQVTTDQAISATALADVTDLVAAVGTVSSLYEFKATLYCSSPDTNGLEFGVNGPTGATVNANIFGATTTTAASGCNIQALATKSATAFVAINGPGVVVIQGFMLTDSTHTGSLSIQADKKTSGTGAVLKGSVLRFRQVY
jgi:hypothetical protein